jgi:hypothetical protein
MLPSEAPAAPAVPAVCGVVLRNAEPAVPAVRTAPDDVNCLLALGSEAAWKQDTWSCSEGGR